ncbi:MAG: arylsulfatase [bacterium]|nr:arylsulfatase [bacterium]
MTVLARFVLASFVVVLATTVFAEEEGAKRPNIVVILADDLGWNDVGYHGSEIRTPNLDRLAREGVELDRFYVQPSCSPTRSSLMTGKSSRRLGIHRPLGKNEGDGLGLDERILPQYLGALGYQPVMVGKWHLGHFIPDYFPQSRGFEHFYGYLTGGIGYWDHNHGGGHDWQRNGETLREEGYSTRLLADEAVRLLRGRDRTRPTFLYLALPAPHLPNEAPEEVVATYPRIENEQRRLHAGMVTELDAAIGRVLDTLAAEGMLEHTLVFFSSDNGGLSPEARFPLFARASELAMRVFDRPMPIASLEFMASNTFDGASDNRPLPGGKMTIAEGGVRVPASIWWPGRLEGGRHERFMTISDVLPTLLEAVGAPGEIPEDLDGASQWGVLSGSGPSRTPDYVIGDTGAMALYRAPWKLVLSGDETRLYDVFVDPFETRDVAAGHADVVTEMTAAAEAWPRHSRPGETSPLRFLWDPDGFGGPEDREPWADVARDRARKAR